MSKNYAKKYLFSLMLLLFLGYIIAFAIFFGVLKDAPNSALFALIPTLITSGTYAGAVFFGTRLIEKEKLTKKIIIAVCVFFPITLAFVTVSGIILIIPSAIRAIHTLVKKDKE